MQWCDRADLTVPRRSRSIRQRSLARFYLVTKGYSVLCVHVVELLVNDLVPFLSYIIAAIVSRSLKSSLFFFSPLSKKKKRKKKKQLVTLPINRRKEKKKKKMSEKLQFYF